MKNECERKFLLRSQAWRAHVSAIRRLRDGLVAVSDLGKVRVRIEEPRAWLTIKGQRHGITRHEFEYEIPLADAERMLSELCGERRIEKTRYLVPHDGLTWEVDVYGGLLEGVAYAEVELPCPTHAIHLPNWVGIEVTGDPRHSKRELSRLARSSLWAAR